MKENRFSIIFIGTSSGQTSLKRFHSSLIVQSKAFNLLIDCGEGTSKALLAQGISFDSIDGILFSHLHPDHSAGLPSFVVQLKQQKRTKPLKIFCHKNLTEVLKTFLKYSFVFIERASFELEYYEFEHVEEINVSENFSFISRQNSHLDKYSQYLDNNNLGFACSSFLLNLGGRKVLYSGDIGSDEDLILFKDQKPEIIITEGTHIEWERILDYIEVNQPEKVYLTHLSGELEIELNQKVKILKQVKNEKIELACDGMAIQI